jgi:hypothetical protein
MPLALDDLDLQTRYMLQSAPVNRNCVLLWRGTVLCAYYNECSTCYVMLILTGTVCWLKQIWYMLPWTPVKRTWGFMISQLGQAGLWLAERLTSWSMLCGDSPATTRPISTLPDRVDHVDDHVDQTFTCLSIINSDRFPFYTKKCFC